MVTYSYCRYDKRYKEYIIRHMSAVVAVTVCWLPAGILHFWNSSYISPHQEAPHGMRDVASVMGALSGLATVLMMILAPLIENRRKTGRWREMGESWMTLRGMQLIQ